MQVIAEKFKPRAMSPQTRQSNGGDINLSVTIDDFGFIGRMTAILEEEEEEYQRKG